MSSLCGKDCYRCVLFESCRGCSLCEASICSRNCRSCFALCLNRPQAAAYLNTLGGPQINLQGNKDINLPIHIPVLPDRMKYKPRYELLPVIAVHAGNAFSRNGEKINKSYTSRGIPGALNIDERTSSVLEFYVKDRTLEGFWDKRKEIYPVLRDLQFIAVIAPNFSVYEDAPRVDHICNIKRSTIVYNEMLDAGIYAIPDVSWFNKSDLDRWCNEINKSNIKVVSFSFQVVDVGLKTTNIWKSCLMGFRYFCQNISSSVKIIIAGLVSPYRVIEIMKAANGNSIHVLNQSAYVQSRRGMLSETREQNPEMSFDQLFERNIEYFNKVYGEMSQSIHNNTFAQIIGWDNDKLIEFYKDYSSAAQELDKKYGIEHTKLDLAFSIVSRQLKKKKQMKYLDLKGE